MRERGIVHRAIAVCFALAQITNSSCYAAPIKRIPHSIRASPSAVPIFGVVELDGIISDVKYPEESLNNHEEGIVHIVVIANRAFVLRRCTAEGASTALNKASCEYIGAQYKKLDDDKLLPDLPPREVTMKWSLTSDALAAIKVFPVLLTTNAAQARYPALSLRNAERGRSVATFLVAPDGSVQDCVAKGASPTLDAETCKIFLTERYKPALNQLGQSVAFTSRRSLNWTLHDSFDDAPLPRR